MAVVVIILVIIHVVVDFIALSVTVSLTQLEALKITLNELQGPRCPLLAAGLQFVP